MSKILHKLSSNGKHSHRYKHFVNCEDVQHDDLYEKQLNDLEGMYQNIKKIKKVVKKYNKNGYSVWVEKNEIKMRKNGTVKTIGMIKNNVHF